MADAVEAVNIQHTIDTPGTGKTIAIVEDDVYLTTMFRDILQLAGKWRLHIFSDGEAAKNQLPHLGADLIILDIGLPYLDGASLYKILRGHSNTKHTPIVVITGSYDWQLHRMGLYAHTCLHKPFTMQDLLRVIRTLLNE